MTSALSSVPTKLSPGTLRSEERPSTRRTGSREPALRVTVWRSGSRGSGGGAGSVRLGAGGRGGGADTTSLTGSGCVTGGVGAGVYLTGSTCTETAGDLDRATRCGFGAGRRTGVSTGEGFLETVG